MLEKSSTIYAPLESNKTVSVFSFSIYFTLEQNGIELEDCPHQPLILPSNVIKAVPSSFVIFCEVPLYSTINMSFLFISGNVNFVIFEAPVPGIVILNSCPWSLPIPNAIIL